MSKSSRILLIKLDEKYILASLKDIVQNIKKKNKIEKVCPKIIIPHIHFLYQSELLWNNQNHVIYYFLSSWNININYTQSITQIIKHDQRYNFS